ncbi:DUF389 domain-containing protein [Microcoleus sp. FACHB-68]|uniref:DUF389 domain-containing protein n=1 Tax=Microcoleus sp. FACHB-68 TaxID=2692826 RepID=UPI001683C06A|nr:DUF389 domain-containing protein [Microcoleus sp. FACHB-68]MBD1937160.1 DUF389 domain-containing protein [Microcoleus sp. FACHB-68]
MQKVSQEELEKLRQNLVEDSQMEVNYLVLTVSSCLIATFGLLSNSAAVIIGAMIIAPLMLPLRGLALGALEGDLILFRQSLITVSAGTVVAVLLSWSVGRLVSLPASEFASEILARTQPNLGDLAIAVAAGFISGFAKIRPKIGDAVAGTAISVALMPPLCVIGISLSQASWAASWGAFLLYLTNLLGITLACMLVFIWGGFYLEGSRLGRALGWVLALTGILVIPLFLSFWTLLTQARVQATLKEKLLRETITVGQQVNLIRPIEVNWNKKPPEVYLSVRAKTPVTSKQVSQVEDYLYERLGQKFVLVFQVGQVSEVRSDQKDPATPPTPTQKTTASPAIPTPKGASQPAIKPPPAAPKRQS